MTENRTGPGLARYIDCAAEGMLSNICALFLEQRSHLCAETKARAEKYCESSDSSLPTEADNHFGSGQQQCMPNDFPTVRSRSCMSCRQEAHFGRTVCFWVPSKMGCFHPSMSHRADITGNRCLWENVDAPPTWFIISSLRGTVCEAHHRALVNSAHKRMKTRTCGWSNCATA